MTRGARPNGLWARNAFSYKQMGGWKKPLDIAMSLASIFVPRCNLGTSQKSY